MDAKTLDRRGAGLLLGALLAAEHAHSALEHLGGAARERCQHALDALTHVDRGARLARTRELATQLLLPGPQRIALLHSSWLAHELSRVHPAVASAVVEALPPALAAELAAFAGTCALPAAARLRLVQAVLGAFQALDDPSLMDGHVESWLVGRASSLFAVLERLAADASAPTEILQQGLQELEAEVRPLALGAAMAFAVLEVQRAGKRLLWRLPRAVGSWVDQGRDGLNFDDRWPAALARLLEERS